MDFEEREYRRIVERRLQILEDSVKYNTKLLEQILDSFPTQKPNKDMQDLLKVQMGVLRPLFDKTQFEGKDELLKTLDNLLGGKL